MVRHMLGHSAARMERGEINEKILGERREGKGLRSVNNAFQFPVAIDP